VDAIYLIYNEFKSAMTQQVVTLRLLPLEHLGEASEDPAAASDAHAEPMPE
jgi:F0F1-type ATP synthase gamma subunit